MKNGRKINGGLPAGPRQLRSKIAELESGQNEYRPTPETSNIDENGFRSLVEAVTDIILRIDANGNLLYINQRVKELLGYQPGEMLGKSIFSFMPPGDAERAEQTFKESAGLNNKNIRLEHSFLHKNGREIRVESVALSVIDKSGRPAGYNSISRDITARQSAEEEKQRYENIVSSSNDMIALLDRNFVYLIANKAYLEPFGLDKQNVIGRTVSEVFGEKTFEDVIKPNAEKCLAGEVVHYYEWFEFPAKGKCYHEINYYPYRGADGRVKGFIVSTRDVTRRMRSEEALRASENKMRSIFRVAPTGIGVSKNRIIMDINDRICEMTGYTKTELIGNNAGMLYSSREDYEYVGKEIYRQIAELGTGVVEVKWLRKDGTIIDIQLAASPIDINDQSKGLAFTALDITERKRAEIELQHSNDLLRAIIEAAPVAIIGLDLEGKVHSIWNPAAEKMLGWSAQEAMGHLLPTVQAEKEDEFRQLRETIRNGMTLNGVEVHRRKRDGTPIDYSVYASPLRDSQGRISGNIAIMVDITERKAMERALEIEKRRLAYILEGTNVGTWEWNVRSGETIFNARWAEMLGYTLDEISPTSAETWKSLSHPDDLKTALELLEKHFKGELDYYECEMRIRHKNGDWVWVLDRGKVAAWTDDGKPLIMAGTHQDISERKRAETALEKRLVALTRPADDAAAITFEDMFNLDDIQRLQDEFAKATGVASLITRPDGTPITAQSNFSRFCSNIIRKTEKGEANCSRSDAELGKVSIDGPTIRPCLSGGLWGAGAGITVGGRHIANWLIGQVRDKTRSVDEVRAYAREIGVNEDEAAEAYMEIPVMSHEQFEWISRALFTLANQLSTAAYQNVQQARFITDRKKAEEALKESEDKFRLLAEQSQLGIGIVQDGVFKYVNKALAEMNGYSIEEILRWKPYDFISTIHPDDRAAIKEQAEKLLSGQVEVVPYYSFRGISKNGDIKYIDMYSKALIYQNRPAYITTIIDTTERKRADEALRESEEKLRRVLYASPDAITVMDLSGKIMECNPAACSIHGYSCADFLGTDFINLVAPPYREMILENRVKCAQGISIGKIECPMLRKDNSEFPADISFGVINDSSGRPQYFVNIIRDLTQQKKLESQLVHSQKMESVGRLAGGVAHDFNNLLTAIIGRAETIELGLKSYDPLLDEVKVIKQASEKAGQLTSQLLAFSRKQTLQPKIVDLNQIIDNMLNMLKRIIGEDIVFNISPGEKLWSIKVDPNQMEQAIVNLAVNARDAMEAGGTLTINTDNIDLKDNTKQGDTEIPAGKYVLLSVSDTGIGMSPEIMANIYEPFFTTKKEGKGTGLGLSMVYGMISQSEGQIAVESAPGSGTTFYIYLPAVGGPVHTVEPAGDSVKTLTGNETILLVEDDETVRKTALEILTRYHYKVIEARNGTDALNLCARLEKPVDLVITDVVMPAMSGPEFIEKLKNIWPEFKCLFISGYSKNNFTDRGPITNYLQKPFPPKSLAMKVRQVLDCHKPNSAVMTMKEDGKPTLV